MTVRAADAIPDLPNIPGGSLAALMERYPDPAPYVGAETPEEAAERKRLAIAAWEARVPVEFRQASYADLGADQEPHIVSRWLDKGGKTLVIRSSAKGNGKSHAAYAVGNDAVRVREVDTVGWSVLDFNDAIRPDGDDVAYEVAKRASLLILDDLGGERLTEWTAERLLGVIDARCRDRKRTVVTTNLTGEELVARYSDRIVDRLTDGMWLATFTGPSRRKPLPF